MPKDSAYAEIHAQLQAVFTAEPSGLANAANMSALLYQGLTGLNWAGFYFLQDGELVLGPFQGKVACVRIAMGRGVCGTAAEQRKTLIVKDVHEFPGHIACDAASRSEIVVPLVKDGRLLGVLDLDSPDLARFDEQDRKGLETAAQLLLQASDFSRLSYS
jgi:L-methionine (R)-S-oxide reductase